MLDKLRRWQLQITGVLLWENLQLFLRQQRARPGFLHLLFLALSLAFAERLNRLLQEPGEAHLTASRMLLCGMKRCRISPCCRVFSSSLH